MTLLPQRLHLWRLSISAATASAAPLRSAMTATLQVGMGVMHCAVLRGVSLAHRQKMSQVVPVSVAWIRAAHCAGTASASCGSHLTSVMIITPQVAMGAAQIARLSKGLSALVAVLLQWTRARRSVEMGGASARRRAMMEIDSPSTAAAKVAPSKLDSRALGVVRFRPTIVKHVTPAAQLARAHLPPSASHVLHRTPFMMRRGLAWRLVCQ